MADGPAPDRRKVSKECQSERVTAMFQYPEKSESRTPRKRSRLTLLTSIAISTRTEPSSVLVYGEVVTCVMARDRDEGAQ
jgi:hypothetical protein